VYDERQWLFTVIDPEPNSSRTAVLDAKNVSHCVNSSINSKSGKPRSSTMA
jgi:hypothetical protein